MSNAPETLVDFIVAEVARQSSEENIRKIVEVNVEKTVARAVESAFASYGHIGKQIEKAVATSLELREPLDVPAYGTMVMAVLRQKMDEILTPLVNERLGKEMEEILAVAPAETDLSKIVEAMKAEEDESERWGTHATVIVEESQSVSGYKSVYLDPGSLEKRYRGDTDKYSAAARFSVNSDGVIYALHIDQKDAKTTVRMGYLPKWQKMLFAAYACGAKIIVGSENDHDTGYGDF
ncbi:hypothetical protein [Aureimonas sp. D3]|uniref:hypothetical protein n=1 Tax=Aureimonas sp. D3 TaxID=1638164 RepID=UPI0007823FA7|nr:hypothetical protein [Aureimonas sp. D3]